MWSYGHPYMDLKEFNEYCVNNLLDKLWNRFSFKWLKYRLIWIMTNIHLLMYLMTLSSHIFLPHIVQPKRIRSNSETLIGSIYLNINTPNNILGNITTTILDHFPQFFIVRDIFFDSPSTKLNIFESDWLKFGQENFICRFYTLSICRLG